MKVTITVPCVTGYLTNTWKPLSLNPLVENIQRNAIKAWLEKDTEETSVRFMQQMSERHFRFLNVSLKNANTLVVSR